MSPLELQQYLHERIPLSRAMQVSVGRVSSESVVLGAPLAPNVNHRETVFGGSSSALAILAAWSLLYTRLKALAISSRLVIQRNTISCDAPILGAFEAESFLAPDADWERFLRMLERKGRGRIAVHARVISAGQIVGRLEGEFVALEPRS